MTPTLDLILLAGSLICFVCAAFSVQSKVNLVAAGLALLVLTMIV